MDLGPLVPITAIVCGLGWGWLGLKKKQLEATTRHALTDADEQRSEKQRLADRVAVLEQIVTDKGYQTAEQIDALRPPRLSDIGQSQWAAPHAQTHEVDR